MSDSEPAETLPLNEIDQNNDGLPRAPINRKKGVIKRGFLNSKGRFYAKDVVSYNRSTTKSRFQRLEFLVILNYDKSRT